LKQKVARSKVVVAETTTFGAEPWKAAVLP
jgi:hypothetical protein